MLGGVLLGGLLALFMQGYKPTEAAITPVPTPTDIHAINQFSGGVQQNLIQQSPIMQAVTPEPPPYTPPPFIPEPTKIITKMQETWFDMGISRENIATLNALTSGIGSQAGYIPLPEAPFPIAPSVLVNFPGLPELTAKQLSGYMAAYGVYR